MRITLAILLSLCSPTMSFSEEFPQDESGLTALHYAAQKEDTSQLKDLLKRGGSPNIREGNTNWTPLFSAVVVGNLKAIQILLDAGSEVNARNIYGATPLHHAQHEEAAILIGHGADVNAASKKGWTPLHSAAFFGRVKTVELLLKNKAAYSVKNSDGKSPLDLAKSKNRKHVVVLLSALEGSTNP